MAGVPPGPCHRRLGVAASARIVEISFAMYWIQNTVQNDKDCGTEKRKHGTNVKQRISHGTNGGDHGTNHTNPQLGVKHGTNPVRVSVLYPTTGGKHGTNPVRVSVLYQIPQLRLYRHDSTVMIVPS
jgi:hypothetical protein